MKNMIQSHVVFVAITFVCSLLQSYHVQGHPKCSEIANMCECFWDWQKILFLCPLNEHKVSIELDRDDSIKIQCFGAAGNLEPDELAVLLPELQVGDIPRLELISCPLPERKSVLNYFDRHQHNQVRAIKFVSGGANMNKNISNEHFADLGGSETFELSGLPNEFKFVPGDAFIHMTKLTSLMIRVQNIQLADDLLAPLTELKFLDLQCNQLKSLAPVFFKNQRKLETLKLAGNLLKSLSEETFEGLDMVKELSLSNNRLEQLDAGVFFHMKNLKVINLSGNNFASLPGGLLSNNIKLSTFKMLENRITLGKLPNRLLANMSELKEVLIKCGLEEISADIFKGSNNIEIIRLRGNSLVNLPADLFVDQPKLITLDLSENLIEELPSGIFKNTASLNELKLSKNSIKRISEDLLQKLRNLKTLHFDENRLEEIHSQALRGPSKLKKIFLQNNQLTIGKFGNSPFQMLGSLNTLNLAHNKMTHLFQDFTLQGLESLDVSYNAFESFSTANLRALVHAKNFLFDLSHNNIKTFTFNLTEIYEEKNIKIIMTSNPLACDCQIHSFVQHLKSSSKDKPEMIKVVVDGLMCASPPTMINQLVADLNPNELC